MENSPRSYAYRILPAVAVMIWGSLYVASRIVLPHIPALFLLFLRFSVSSVLLLASAIRKHVAWIRREDFGEILLVGVLGYFFSNAALLLGVKYASASFSSLINALTPVGITFFAVWLLKEKIERKDMVSLILAVAGAAVIIGAPGKENTLRGVLYSAASVIIWSYVTIHVKKLTVRYDPLLVTGTGMGIAAILSLPASALYIYLTGETVTFSTDMIFPVLYICLICTAFSHLLWNRVLAKLPATVCASYYPLQPLTSMLLGVILLGERLTPGFLFGTAMIITAMILHSSGASEEQRTYSEEAAGEDDHEQTD